jgi:multidrug efflux pump subunit AcrA (membrane-fusion protein)
MSTSLEKSEAAPSWVDDFGFEESPLGDQQGPRHWRRWLALAVALATVVGGVVWFVNPFGATATATRVTAAATTGTIVASVSISGSVASSSVNELNFGATGTVTAVNVKPGDKVTAGELLAAIDDSLLQAQVATAEANLAAAEARLALDQAGPTAADRTTALNSIRSARQQLAVAKQSSTLSVQQNALKLSQTQSALETAQARLAADIAAGPPIATITADQNTITQTQQQIDTLTLQIQAANDQAALTANQNALKLNQLQAQMAADTTTYGAGSTQVAADQQQINTLTLQILSASVLANDTTQQNALKLSQLQATLAAAQAKLAADTVAGPPSATIQADQAAIDSAQQQLDSLKLANQSSSLSSSNSIASAEISLSNAEAAYTLKIVPTTPAQLASDKASVAAAEQTLATLKTTGATITSPIDGTVTVVNVKIGQAVTGSPSSTSSSSASTTGQIEVMDLAHLQIAGEASETDIPKLKMDQAATITAAALGTETVVGKVCALSVVGTQISGVASFGVTVCLDGSDPALLVGMSATAAVVTSRADGAVLVPSLAVKTVGGQQVVTVLGADGKTETNVPVTVGISNGSETQILTGLSGTETVVESIQTITQTRGGGAGFGGGGRGLVGGFGGG